MKYSHEIHLFIIASVLLEVHGLIIQYSNQIKSNHAQLIIESNQFKSNNLVTKKHKSNQFNYSNSADDSNQLKSNLNQIVLCQINPNQSIALN